MADYHTVNEDDGSMLISISRETNHHGNNAGIENKSSEPDENEIMRRKDRKHADNIIRDCENMRCGIGYQLTRNSIECM